MRETGLVAGLPLPVGLVGFAFDVSSFAGADLLSRWSSNAIEGGSLWLGDRFVAMRNALILAADRVGLERDRGVIALAPLCI